MKKSKNTIAYIDGANLHKGVKALGWKLDYARLRTWLTHRYGVGSACIFIGLIPKYKDLYTYLHKCDFGIIYKDVIYDGDGKAKGNCDGDLIVQAMRDAYEINDTHAILVTSDGDYAPLVKFLIEKERMGAIISPAPSKQCSVLLKRTGAPIAYLDDKKKLLEVQNEKAPGGNASRPGSLS